MSEGDEGPASVPFDTATLMQAEEEEDSDTELMTTAEVVQKFRRVWLNEKLAPELLTPRTELVDCLVEQINALKTNISKAARVDFIVDMHREEMDRLRFMVSSYLRIRIEKIEKYVWHLLDEEKKHVQGSSSRMSPSELQYAQEHASNLESHMQSVALRHLPGTRYQTIDANMVKRGPPLDSYVFFQVKQNVPGLLLDDGTASGRTEEVDLDKGTQHIMRYKPLSPYVESDAVHLM